MSGLPRGWVEATIRDLCELINGKAFKPSDWRTEGLPIVRIQNLNNPNSTFNYYQGLVEEKFLIEDGQLLFAWSGTPGTSFGAHVWNGGRAVLNQHIFKVTFPSDLINKHFLRNAINQKLEELIGKAHGGAGLQHVTKGKFEETLISLPPMAEQKRIVAKLDALNAKSARARTELARIETLVSRYKQAVLSKAFSGELTRDWRIQMKAKESSIGRLEELLSIPVRNGLSVKGSDTPPGFPALKLSALRSRDVNLDDVRYIPINDLKASRFLLEAGDILVSRGNGTRSLVGIASLVPTLTRPTIFPDTAFRIRVDDAKALPLWLTSIWNAPQVRSQIEFVAKTTAGIWKISQKDLATIRLSFPSTIDEQHEIVRRIESAFAKIDRLAKEAKRALELVGRLDEAILAQAFHGELVPQDENDEPAELLLARIRAERDKAPKARRGRKAVGQ